jgi:hypothetical protein
MNYYGPSKKADRTERNFSKRKRKSELTTRDTKQQALDLTIYGHPCIRHRDDTVAMYFHQEKHLIDLFENDVNEGFDLNQDCDDDYTSYSISERKPNDLHKDLSKGVNTESPKLYVDRYDVRMHMELSALYPSRNHRIKNMDDGPDPDLTKEELDAVNLERYLDLPSMSKENTSYDSIHVERSTDNDSSTMHFDRIVHTVTDNNNAVALPMNHSSGGMIENQTKSMNELFELNEVDRASLPQNMIVVCENFVLILNQRNLYNSILFLIHDCLLYILQPQTKRVNDIIIMTANKAKDNPQFEVLLKVKQENNPTFTFLDCAHELHAYYKWHRNGGMRQKDEKEANLQNGTLKMMELYGSSSSDDDDDDDDGEVENDDCNVSNIKMQDDHKGHNIERKDDVKPSNNLIHEVLSKEERQKRRLEKAKLLKDHFSTKHHKTSRS